MGLHSCVDGGKLWGCAWELEWEGGRDCDGVRVLMWARLFGCDGDHGDCDDAGDGDSDSGESDVDNCRGVDGVVVMRVFWPSSVLRQPR